MKRAARIPIANPIKVNKAISARIDGIFSLDRPPIWSPKLREAISAELGAGATGPLIEQAEQLERYMAERERLLGFQLVLFVALALGLSQVGTRAKARAEENYDLREAELVFGLPTSMAFVIVLVCT